MTESFFFYLGNSKPFTSLFFVLFGLKDGFDLPLTNLIWIKKLGSQTKGINFKLF